MKRSGLILGIALGGLGLALVLRRMDLGVFVQELRQADYMALLWYVPLFFLDMLLRAFRWTLLFPAQSKPGLFVAYNAMMLGNAANIFTPARGGDVLRAVTLGLKAERSKSEALGTVLVERVVDLACACLLMAAVSPYVSFDPAMRRGAFALGGGIFLVIVMVSLCGLLGKERTLALVPRLMPAWLRERLEQLLWAFVYGIQRIGARNSVLPFALATVAIWLLEAACLWAVLAALHVDFSLVMLGGLLLFAVFGAMVPGPPGQVGVFEYAVTSGALLLGVAQGAPLAFLWHGMSLILSGCAGLLALLSLRQQALRRNGTSGALGGSDRVNRDKKKLCLMGKCVLYAAWLLVLLLVVWGTLPDLVRPGWLTRLCLFLFYRNYAL